MYLENKDENVEHQSRLPINKKHIALGNSPEVIDYYKEHGKYPSGVYIPENKDGK